MKHKLLILFLALVASEVVTFAQSGTCGTNLTWELSDGILTISGTGKMNNYSSSYSPWDSYLNKISAVIISESVTSIGNYAFSNCVNLTSVTIPNSVTSIGDYAFNKCGGLTYITIPNSITSIGGYAFGYCNNLISIEIPNSVKSIGESAFSNCSSLTSIIIPNSVSSLKRHIFGGCSSLTSIEIPNSITNIGSYAFSVCSSLISVEIPNSVTGIGGDAFFGCSSLTSVTIPNSVISIGAEAFERCSSLTSVEIPNSVTSIGDRAFDYCSSLTSIEIPNSVKTMGENAFSDCSKLTSLTLNSTALVEKDYYNSTILSTYFSSTPISKLIIGDDVTSIGSKAFAGCSSLTSVTIPNSVTSIGKSAFQGCTDLTSVGNLSNVTNIGDYAFFNCSKLTSDGNLSNITSIGESAFQYCSSLKSVTMGDDITTIGANAFQGCTYLEDIVIGSGIGVDYGIGQNAFNGCRYLLSVTCKAVYPPVINEYVFQDCGVLGGIDLFVPEESVKRYKKATVWSEFNIIGANIVQCSETKTPDGTTICPSELPFVWEGLTFTEAGSKTKTLQSVGGCDSVVTFTLSVYPEITNYETKVLWDDELPYTWEGITFTEAGTETKTLTASTGCDSTVTFTLRVRERHITLQENEDAGYYDLFSQDYNGQTVTTATLNRQFGFGKWATLCLPFNVNKAMMMSLGLNGRVYEFRHADLWDDVAQIYFAPAQSIEAGKGYIVNANAKLALKTSFVFPNVTINTDSDTGDITTLTGYNDGTDNLYLVGTLRTGLLQGSIDGNTYLGLKNNMLYYPNSTSGTAIRAYRGFFRSTEPMKAHKVRIIVEGEASEELLIDNGELMVGGDALNDMQTTVRKYIRNGILLIERNGKTYTAQGQHID